MILRQLSKLLEKMETQYVKEESIDKLAEMVINISKIRYAYTKLYNFITRFNSIKASIERRK